MNKASEKGPEHLEPASFSRALIVICSTIGEEPPTLERGKPMVVLQCPCENRHQLWGSSGGLEGSTNGCSSMSTKRV
jgi:hypothetical protein